MDRQVRVATQLLVLAVSLTTAVRIAGPRDIIAKLTNSKYDKYMTPTQEQEQSTQVTIGMYIEGMSSVRVQTMDFHVDIYFEQRWTDTRLVHNNADRVLIRDPAIVDMMWHPDLYFANANSAKFFDVTAPNFFLWIFPNGTVHHDLRISLTVLCNMDFTKYPLDSQQCDIRVLSYAYTMDQVNVSWRDKEPIISNKQLRFPDMEMVNAEPRYCDGTYINGNWSCIRAVFNLRREKMHHILQNYVPTVLIVIISWFSFWLDVESVPGRVSLCITTLLTLATQASSARMALPQVSYAKAIDVWLEACLGFVFGVLIEFTVVNYLARCGSGGKRAATELLMSEGRRSARKAAAALLANGGNVEMDFYDEELLRHRFKQRIPSEPNEENPDQQMFYQRHDCACCHAEAAIQNRRKRRANKAMANYIDRLCRVLFPAAFAVFNFIYWIYYLAIP